MATKKKKSDSTEKRKPVASSFTTGMSKEEIRRKQFNRPLPPTPAALKSEFGVGHDLSQRIERQRRESKAKPTTNAPKSKKSTSRDSARIKASVDSARKQLAESSVKFAKKKAAKPKETAQTKKIRGTARAIERDRLNKDVKTLESHNVLNTEKRRHKRDAATIRKAQTGALDALDSVAFKKKKKRK